MFGFIKKTLKVTFISAILLGLAGVGAFAFMGEHRSHAVVHELRDNLLEAIDNNIADPQALRTQLREMEEEYPKRIALVRGDLAELQYEMRQLEKESTVSARVVALVDGDIEVLETRLAVQFQSGEMRLASIVVDEHIYTPDRARIRLSQMRNTRLAHANRAADARHDLAYLEKQSGRLEELAIKLEAERVEFQAQILGLTRQIDAIARNDRLIGLLEKRNRTIEECSRYEAVSIDQITVRLEEIQHRQEAELDLLSSAERATDYEGLARMQIANEDLAFPESAGLAPPHPLDRQLELETY
jgi:hypothetical protein